MLSRRQFVGGMLASVAGGCASSSDSTLGLFAKTVTGKPHSSDDYPLNAKQIHDLPYATLGVRIADNPRAVVVLAAVEGQQLHWVAADRVSFYTDSAWLVRTHGLGRDLVATRWTDNGDPLGEFARTGVAPAAGVYRKIDLVNGEERGIAVESHFRVVGDETLVIQGQEHFCTRIDETAKMPTWRWKTRNSFWIAPESGRAWRSVQQYCPEMPPIQLELLKPAAVQT